MQKSYEFNPQLLFGVLLLQTTKRMGTPWRRQTIREDAGASNDVASSASGDEDDNESREALVSRMDQLVLQPKVLFHICLTKSKF